MIRPLIVVLCLTACGLPGPEPRPDGTVPNGIGGNVDKQWSQIQAHKGPVRLTGHYFSAQTLWLAYPEACVTEDAVFEFHAPHYLGLGIPLSDADYQRYVVRGWAEEYPPNLKAWFLSHYGTQKVGDVLNHRYLTGGEVLAMGEIPHCDQQKARPLLAG